MACFDLFYFSAVVFALNEPDPEQTAGFIGGDDGFAYPGWGWSGIWMVLSVAVWSAASIAKQLPYSSRQTKLMVDPNK